LSIQLGYNPDIDLIERELMILQSIHFENVVALLEWFRDKKQCFLVFEYVEWVGYQWIVEIEESFSLSLEHVTSTSRTSSWFAHRADETISLSIIQCHPLVPYA
jgi:hypothetical protein